MAISPATYERVALEDPEGQWELHCGRLRRKPPMTMPHNELQAELAYLLESAINRDAYAVRQVSRAQAGSGRYYVPDVMVVPRTYVARFRDAPGTLEAYSEPLPLVVEVWSRSTGDYDVDEKLPEYQRRGDLEIWRVHPYDRVVTTWRRQPDGSYTESTHASGLLPLHAIPGATIDLDRLFAALDR